ncbi:MAG: disulfide bond formation protein B [Gammaproteobacteria bacterium]|nr:disulfide bond formation protein B [Gammaproteobacteria bacterium]
MLAFLSPRRLFALMFLASAALLGTAFYMEYVMLLEPCPLCMMQRIWVAIAAVLALAAAVHGRGIRIWSGLIGAAALIGSGFSLRQLWLQSLPPDQVPACGPGLSYMMEVFPPIEVLEAMVFGTGNCAEVSWTLLGLSIPAWVLIAFVALLAGSVVNWTRAGSDDA